MINQSIYKYFNVLQISKRVILLLSVNQSVFKYYEKE